MFTTAPFSIRTYRGMGELDPPGTYRERGVEGEREPPARGQHINFGKTALIAVFRANRKFLNDCIGLRLFARVAAVEILRAHILRKNGFAVFRANRQFPSGFAGQSPVCGHRNRGEVNERFF